MDTKSSPSVPAVKYGPPTYEKLSARILKECGKVAGHENIGRYYSMGCVRDVSIKARVVPPLEFQQPGKGQDRVFSGLVVNEGQTVPITVVADGVSDSENGGQAAEEAVIAAVRQLSVLKPGLDHAEVSDILGSVFDQAGVSLRNKKIPGATTLLVGFPYIHPPRGGSSTRDGVGWWHYGYIGDGGMTVISKAKDRRIDGRSMSTFLLSPQKFVATASVSSKGCTHRPVIGCVQYVPGDSLVMMTDGFGDLDRWL